MTELLTTIKQSFDLDEANKMLLDSIFSKCKITSKDKAIIENLIKYKLDFNSVCAYLISEHKLQDLNCNDDVVELLTIYLQ